MPALVAVWELSDHRCGKRLGLCLPELLASLERHGELRLSPDVAAQLCQLSPATIDRLLTRARAHRPRTQARTRRAPSAISRLVPVRTLGDWAGVEPGALKADLVCHSGERNDAFLLTTLVAVNVATRWTERQAVWGKGKGRVSSAVHHLRQRLPMPLRALHTDNGGEFINGLLAAWCAAEGITFTRGRPYQKNDQAYVEQRNWLVVRRIVGYDRYATKDAYALLQRLYGDLRWHLNAFQPMRKLIAKEHQGARVTKRYDVAQTPYRRLLDSEVLTDDQIAQFEAAYARINRVQLKARIDATVTALWTCAEDGH